MMLLPSDATVLPMYMELFILKLVNTPWAVILPAGMAPFAVYLTYTYYKTVMHRDMVDAARGGRLLRPADVPLYRPALGAKRGSPCCSSPSLPRCGTVSLPR